MKVFPATPYVFEVVTPSGTAFIEIEATEYDSPAPFNISADYITRNAIEKALTGAIGFDGYLINLKAESPSNLRQAFLSRGFKFSVPIGHLPDELPDDEIYNLADGEEEN